MLKGKKVILAVCGSIAAYKTAFFVRLLRKSGAEVKVIMTRSAIDFITPLTLSTLSKNPVYTKFFEKESGEWTSHVELGLWADVMVIAPASANTIAKLANGLCDNLLTATYLSARCDVMIAPAMDLDMYGHETTTQNIATLAENGDIIIESRDGELASGLSGEGRMAEPEELMLELEDYFAVKESLKEKNVLITSGPTLEPIDAVRFIGNHSSGKMGNALAMECAKRGATVHLVSGPVHQLPNHPNISVSKVNTAEEMLEEARKHHQKSDIAIFAAAVSDYRSKNISTEKFKRDGKSIVLELLENPDIAMELGKMKKSGQVHLGFALETNKDESKPLAKLKKKNFDLIVLNSLDDANAGFTHATNKITIFDKENNRYPFELKDKREVARDILSLVVERIK